MKKTSLATLYIVRHGQTHDNKDNIWSSRSTRLTQKGEQEAKRIAKRFKPVHFDEVFSSDFVRAKRTAEIIVLEKKLAVQTTAALRETNFGRFEGRKIDELMAEFGHLFKLREKLTDSEFLRYKFFPEMESLQEALIRFNTFLREIAVAYKGKNILVVSHSGIMRAFLVHLGFGSFKKLPISGIKNTAYIKIESDGIDFFLKKTRGIEKVA